MCTINPSVTLALALALPTREKKKGDEGAQNHKDGSTGLNSLLVCTELRARDGSLDLLKDGLKSINTEE